MKSYQTVLFDLDGTLVDNFDAIFLAWEKCREEFSLPAVSFAEVKSQVGGSTHKTLARLTSPALADEILPRFRIYFKELMMEGLFVLPGVEEFLVHLQEKSITAAVYTNKFGSYARQICDHLNISHYFAEILGAEDTEWIKPEPRLTSYLLKKLQDAGHPVSLETTLMVGDSPFDIETGVNANIDTAAIATGTHSAEELAHHSPAPTKVFANMHELHTAWF